MSAAATDVVPLRSDGGRAEPAGECAALVDLEERVRHFVIAHCEAQRGYETWLGTNRLEVRASEKMLTTLLEMPKD